MEGTCLPGLLEGMLIDQIEITEHGLVISVDVFAPYILKRWRDGKRNGLTLWKELREQGYIRSERTVYRYLETLKRAYDLPRSVFRR